MKSHCAHLQGRSRVAGCSACVDLLGAVDNIKGVAFDVRVPCACCEGGRESKVQLRCLQKGPTLEFSVRFTLPQAQQCCKLPEIMCSHCGCHFAVPKSAPASGIHPYCASSVSRTASFYWHWCRSHVNNRPHEFRFYFHCLAHFLAREHMYGTSPGRRLRLGELLAHMPVGVTCKSWAVSLDSI